MKFISSTILGSNRNQEKLAANREFLIVKYSYYDDKTTMMLGQTKKLVGS